MEGDEHMLLAIALDFNFRGIDNRLLIYSTFPPGPS